MKPAIQFAVCSVLVGILFIASCKKEYSCQGCLNNNKPPIANAGNDTTITLPANTANLDGSKSTDPDNNITNYRWTKISGPPSFNITNASSVQTQVSNLTQGVYSFELKVTDAGGLSAADTVQVMVNAPPHIDSSLVGKEFVFDAKWELDVQDLGPPGYVTSFVNPSPSFSIAALLSNPIQISIQLDTSSVWINAAYWDWYTGSGPPPNNGYIWDFPGYPYSSMSAFDIEPDPDNHELAGRSFKVKVKF